MHGNITQVSKKPICESDYITEDKYYDHWFTYQIADYVSDDVNREEDIEWFKDASEGIVVEKDEHGYYFMISDKEKYFKEQFKEFNRILPELNGIAINDFINSIDCKVFALKNAYEDKYGFYIDDDDGKLSSLDSFVRHAETNVKYYIGGVVDYHS